MFLTNFRNEKIKPLYYLQLCNIHVNKNCKNMEGEDHFYFITSLFFELILNDSVSFYHMRVRSTQSNQERSVEKRPVHRKKVIWIGI